MARLTFPNPINYRNNIGIGISDFVIHDGKWITMNPPYAGLFPEERPDWIRTGTKCSFCNVNFAILFVEKEKDDRCGHFICKTCNEIINPYTETMKKKTYSTSTQESGSCENYSLEENTGIYRKISH
jgi:hypothetical protein